MTATATQPLRLTVCPSDVLFFRDGRPFDAASGGSGAISTFPLPQTFAGGIRTGLLIAAGLVPEDVGRKIAAALGDHKGDINAAFQAVVTEAGQPWLADIAIRGPWLYKDSKRLVRVPRTLVKIDLGSPPDGPPEKDWPRDTLVPVENAVVGWNPPIKGMLPLVASESGNRSDASEALSGWVPEEKLLEWLNGKLPAVELAKLVIADSDLFGYEARTGIQIDPKRRAAADGMIYTARMLRLEKGVSFACELAGPEAALKQAAVKLGKSPVIRLGGEGKTASIFVDGDVTPGDQSAKPTVRRWCVLTTPAIFGDTEGWKPPAELGQLVAAAVDKPIPVSGWQMAVRAKQEGVRGYARGGPKRNRWAVPAGSVFIFDGGGPTPSQFGNETEVGFGCCLWGRPLEDK